MEHLQSTEAAESALTITAPAPPKEPETATAHPPTVAGMAGLLAAGLFPGFGIAACLWWAYGAASPPEKRVLAKAMLWLHGFGLCAVLLGLCLWVLGLAGVL